MTRFEELLKRDKTHEGDQERYALFFIISNIEGLYNWVNKIYDFSDHSIEPEALDTLPLSGGERRMLGLAFNLYNNLTIPYSILDLFGGIDGHFREIAFNAITLKVTGQLIDK